MTDDTPYASALSIHDVETINVKRHHREDLHCLTIELIGADPFRKTIISVWRGNDQTPEFMVEDRRVEVA